MDLQQIQNQCVEKLKGLQRFFKRQISHRYLLPEGEVLMERAVSEMIRLYAGHGLEVQEFTFYDGRHQGKLLQIRNGSGSPSRDLFRTLGGQLCSICLRFLPTDDGLSVEISQGKWLDKVIAGSLSWSIFPPLLALPIWGGLKQKNLMERVEGDLLDWFKQQPEGIAVPMDMIES